MLKIAAVAELVDLPAGRQARTIQNYVLCLLYKKQE